MADFFDKAKDDMTTTRGRLKSQQKERFNTTGTNIRMNYKDPLNNTTFLSASMLLQHASQHISFPKANRFERIRINTTYKFSKLQYPSQLSSKYSTMGFGRKDIFPKHHYLNAFEYPAPNRYLSHSEILNNNKKGKTFGVSREKYERAVQMDDPKFICLNTAAVYPSPDRYKFESTNLGKSMPKYSFRKRTVYQKQNSNPGANKYNVKEEFTYGQKHLQRSQGFGQKSDFTINESMQFPGPKYKIPSQFDRFTNNYKKERKRKIEMVAEMRRTK